MLKFSALSLTIVLIFLCGSCSSQKKKSKYLDTDMYAFSSPKVVELETELDEISGIAYYPKDTSVFAIVDEAGIIYKIPLNDPKHSRSWTFSKGRDYEDIVLIDSTFYILVSNGDIELLKFKNDKPYAVKIDFSMGGKKDNEFETLYKNEFDNSLSLICKSCTDDKKEELTSFKISLGDSMFIGEDKKYDMRSFIQKFGLDKHLKPSAAAINPINGDIYMVSAILSVIVIFGRDKEFKEYIKLNPSIYKQPEGIAFTPEGDLIISNEFAEQGLATLLLLKNKKK